MVYNIVCIIIPTHRGRKRPQIYVKEWVVERERSSECVGKEV